MSIFDDSASVILWVNSVGNLGRLPSIATTCDASFSGVALPRSASPTDFARARAQKRPDGSAIHASLYEIAFTSATAEHPHVKAALAANKQNAHRVDLAERDSEARAASVAGAFADQVIADVMRLNPTGVVLDCEVPDSALASFMATAVDLVRAVFPSRALLLNVAPNKQGFLPIGRLQADPNLYAQTQCYYGDMSRFGEAQAMKLLTDAGVPVARASLCIGAQALAKVGGEWKRVSNVPTAFYQGAAVAKIPGPSLVFSDDLWADSGLA